MITASGAGAAFVAVPPKRLKPKSPQAARLTPNARSPLPSQSPQRQNNPVLISSTAPPPSNIDAGQVIEGLVLSRNRAVAAAIAGRPNSPSLVGIGEDEWPRGFPEPKENQTSCNTDGPHPGELWVPSSSAPSFSLYETSFYRSGSAGSTSTQSTLKPTRSNSSADERPLSRTTRKFSRPRPRSIHSHSPTLGSSPGSDCSGFLGPAGTKPSDGVSSYPPIRDIYIAVIGAAGVGKSNFIQRAYDLKSLPSKGEVPMINLGIDGTQYNVKLVEMDMARIDLEQHPLQWQKTDGQRLPFVDGVLLLYDVTNPVSIVKLPESLEAFSRANLPVCLASTKCDAPQRQLNPKNLEQIGSVGGYEQIQTSIRHQDGQKKCVAAVLSMISRRNDKIPRSPNGRRRANSSAANSRATSPRPSTGGHNRASSEFSSTFFRDSLEGSSIHGERLPRTPVSPALGTIATHPSACAQFTEQKRSEPSSAAPHTEASANPISMHVAGRSSSQSSLPSYSSSDDRSQISFVESDDEDSSYHDQDEIPILEREGEFDDENTDDKQAPNKGWNWDELVDRLLSLPMSRSDQAFNVAFLCFYRKFASPRELLVAIMDRFEKAELQERIALQRLPTQMRYCNVLHQWVSSHPGDFAHLTTRQKLLSFAERISRNRSFSFLANGIMEMMTLEPKDEDEVWARTDADSEKRTSLQSFLTDSSFPDSKDDFAGGGTFFLDLQTRNSLQLPHPGTEVDLSKRVSDVSYETITSAGSSHALVSGPSEISSPNPTSRLLVSPSSQYDMFMGMSVDEIADELTKIDWAEFSKIKTRDLIQHISVSPDLKDKAPNLTPINNMINHFNHVAYWVATVILDRPKAKHRGNALEKFMEVAWALRHKNNYNSLGAIIAGINGTAVHRLNQTRGYVRPDVHKNFMRLELLMGTQKGHSKYRLAWENTTTERIPFLPLHRRDLVVADEGNRTFVGDRINWQKFQVMGEVLMVVLRSQSMPYKNLAGNPIVGQLIQEAVMTMNDDELYERSVQLESGAPTPASRKRNWFRG